MEIHEEGKRDLKKVLLKLPSNSNFEFSKHTRTEIRKALFLSISQNGTFLNWLFPSSFPSQINRDSMVDKIENEYDWAFNSYYKSLVSKRDPKHGTHNHRAYHKNSPCARIFRKGEPIHRCLTCGFDDTCALCSHCFQPEYHEGHKVHIGICQRENGGVCDCGDPEAWTRELDCPYASVDDVFEIYDRELPKNLADSILTTLETILDFIIDVISQSDLQFEDPETTTVSTIELNTVKSTLDSAKYGDASFTDANNDQYFLILFNDQVRYYRDAVQRVHLASKKVKEFAIMVTDKVQKFGKAKVISSKNIKLLLERQKILSATGLATCIRSHRDVFREEMCDEIILWLNDFAESELFKTNTAVKDLFCRVFCEKWEKGLLVDTKEEDEDETYSYKVGTLDPNLKIPKIQSREQASKSHWAYTPSKWNLSDDLCQECEYNINTNEFARNVSHHGSRLQYMIYLDVRFWKAARTLLHDMYSTSLITNLHYKNIICYQYVDIYPTIVDMYLTMDREPELSIMPTLSTQLFTCPTNSAEIIKHGDLTRILASIYGFFTTENIKAPENIDVTHQVSIKSLKNRRWGQLFFDLSYILTRSKSSKFIPNSNVVPMTCDLLVLFQGRPVMVREKTNHVEYESPDYSTFFQAVSVFYQYGEVIASALKTTRETESCEILHNYQLAIQYVLNCLLNLEDRNFPGLVNDEIDVNLVSTKQLIQEPRTGEVIHASRVDEDKVSFLHPVHSFLSWLIEFAKFDDIMQLKQVFQAIRQNRSTPSTLPTIEVSIFDYPIKTVVLMSQIKAGYWVRNGFSVKSQLQLYKNTSLRDYGYARDLFLIQMFANIYHPDVVTFLILNRWMLLDNWLHQKDTSSYDEKTLSYMLEECLNFFIHLLTEDIHLKGDDEEVLLKTKVQREIIHSLCFGPMGYSKLCAQMPDHIVADRRFEIILKDMTTFKAPKTSNDFGVYYLKDEYLDEINPYYCHYTANVKDDAIKFVKSRISKKTGKPIGDVIIEPKKMNPNDLGIYKHIGNFSTSSHFTTFIIKTLLYVCARDQKEVESLLETVLHLIHICCLEQTTDIENYGTFYEKFVVEDADFKTSIAALLYRILLKDDYKSTHTKIRFIFKILTEKYGDSISTVMESQIENFDAEKIDLKSCDIDTENEIGKKKRMAKERQLKLMAKFKKQQSSFIKKNHVENLQFDSDTEMEDSDDHVAWKFPENHCMLCQNAADDGGPFGIITYISRSSEFRTVPFDDQYWFLKSFSDNVDLNTSEYESESHSWSHNNPTTEKWKSYMNDVSKSSVIGPGFDSTDNVESHLVSSSCGHGMHYQCYVNYLNNSRSRQNQITRNTPENADRKEFLCPLCKALNNLFIPLLWSGNDRSLSRFFQRHPGQNVFANLQIEQTKDKDWIGEFTRVAEKDMDSDSILTNVGKEIISMDVSKELSSDQRQFRLLLSNMFQVLSLFTFPQIFKADSTFIFVNTIKSIEISLRGISSQGKLIIHQLSNNALINLRILNEFRNSSTLMKVKNWVDSPNPKTDAYTKSFANIFALSQKSLIPSILEADFFQYLVNIVPLPSLGFSFNSILETTFAAHLVQCLNILARDISKQCLRGNWGYTLVDIPTIADVPLNVSQDALLCFKKLCQFDDEKQQQVGDDNKFGEVIYSMLVKTATPFLRRAAIYSYVHCANLDRIDFSIYPETEIEADRLCSMMNIKPVCDFLQSFLDGESYESEIFHKFVNYTKTMPKLKNILLYLKKELEYPGIVKLVELPERLDFFFTKYYYSDKHNNPNMTIEDPAICLFCGKVVDVQKQAIGCKEGQCTTHYLKECANDVGLFLLPKDRSLLLLHKNGGSFYGAPFLDEHGEVADESKKSKALHLMKPRYDDFMRNIWLQHNVQNCIVRHLDNVLDPGGWDTL